MNIILVGMPASGKTSVSKILGQTLSMQVYDTDALIVEKHGNINEIFQKYGEEYFRDIETEIVEELCAKQNAIISTGGGLVLKQKNRELLKSCGKIVYLQAETETLIKRCTGDNFRPLLKGGAEQKLKELYAARTPIYQAAADFVVKTDNLTPNGVAKKITELFK